MNETIHERIQTIVNVFGDNKNTVIANKLGISEANIRGYIKGIKPKEDILEKIVKSFDISPLWLLTGEGSIHNSKKNSIVQSTMPTAVSNNRHIGKPYFDVDFICGFDEIINSQVSIPTANIIIQGFEKADLWCNVSGHSMEPKISHGDIIALRKCTIEDIQYGEIYAVVLDTIRTIKILRRSKDPNKLRFIPINIENYDEKEYPISRILHIYEVIGSISKFF
jgi:phage repressor protein C with HTH and peptisase S24 domain